MRLAATNFACVIIILFVASCASVKKVKISDLDWRYQYSKDWFELKLIDDTLALFKNDNTEITLIEIKTGSTVALPATNKIKFMKTTDSTSLNSSFEFRGAASFTERIPLLTNTKYKYSDVILVRRNAKLRGLNENFSLKCKRKADEKRIELIFKSSNFENVEKVICVGQDELIIQYSSSLDTLYHRGIGKIKLSNYFK